MSRGSVGGGRREQFRARVTVRGCSSWPPTRCSRCTITGPRSPGASGTAAGRAATASSAPGSRDAPAPAARPRRDRGGARAGAPGRVPRGARGPEPRRRRMPRRRHRRLGGSWRAAITAAGTGIAAVDALTNGGADAAFLARAPAGPPRPPGAGHGLLPAEQRRGRRGRARRARRAGADRRLRRAPRQRHPGDLLRRTRASSTCRSTSGRCTRGPDATTRSARAPARARP